MMGATNKENKMLNCSLSSGQGSYPKRDWMRTVMATRWFGLFSDAF